MKTNLSRRSVKFICLFLLCLAGLSARGQTTATWTGSIGDGAWNTDGNWDTGAAPGPVTNAVIPSGVTVNYNSPMVAAGFFNGLTLNGTVNVSADGFTINPGGAGAFTTPAGGSGVLRVLSGGSVLITNCTSSAISNTAILDVQTGGSFTLTNTDSGGTLTFGLNNTTTQAGFTNSGGTITISQKISIRSSTGRVIMTGGTLNAPGGLSYDEGNNDGSQPMIFTGGTANLGLVGVTRTTSTGGFIVAGGTVKTTGIQIGTSNSRGFGSITNGVLTNNGIFTICDRANGATSGTRGIQYLIRGGTVANVGGNSIIIGNQSNAGGSQSVDGGTLDMNAGTLITEGITLVKDTTMSSCWGTFTLSGSGIVYLGSNGIVGNVGVSSTAYNVNLNGGTIAAKTNTFFNARLAFGSGGPTFQADDGNGNARQMDLNDILSGSGALTKTGAGTLNINSNANYTGNTTVAAGTLAVGVNGGIGSGLLLTVYSNATLDVSALASPFTLQSTRTLYGAGLIKGNFAAASGSIINPTNPATALAGTLAFNNGLTLTGGVTCHFDLSTAGPGANNDLVTVAGDLTASGTNTVELAGGGAPGSVHPLITYGGSFNGSLANFVVSGASGTLTNNTVTKTISFLVASVVRSATNVVWKAASPANSDWDVLNRSNWLNGAAQDYFVNGDTVTFNNTGIASSNINIVGNVSPTSLTVDTTGNYTLSGSGAITGGGPLVKSNTGTLVLNTTNSYAGITTIAGGVLEVNNLANGGQPSSIGASGPGAASLVLSNATLRYSGGNFTSDRGATLTSNSTFEISTANSTLTLNGGFAGTGQLIKTGPGALIVGTASAATGGAVINGGTLGFAVATAPGPTSVGITNNGATMRIIGAIVLDQISEHNGTTTIELSGVGGGNACLRGSWFGSGYVNINFLQQNTAQVFTIGGQGSFGGNMTNFSGTVDFGTNSGVLRINNDNSTFNFGSDTATFNVGTGNASLNQRNGSTTTMLGALFGGPNTRLSGRGSSGTAGTATYSIGGKNIDCNFDGSIVDGSSPTAITKVGTAKLTLNGNSTHTGATIVNNGTLEVNGNLSASAVTVNAGTLTGNGGSAGVLTINNGATFKPGGDTIGKYTAGAEVYLLTGSTNIFQLDKAHTTNDTLVNIGSISYGGTLVVTNLGGTLANGDVFQLFSFSGGPSSGGTFDQIILPTPPSGIEWNTNEIYATGRLILGTVAPPVLHVNTFDLTGNTLGLNGVNGTPSATYYVVTSADIAAPPATWTPISTNAFDQNGAFSLSITVDTSGPKRFFRVLDTGEVPVGNRPAH